MIGDQVGQPACVALTYRAGFPVAPPPVHLQHDDDALGGEPGRLILDQLRARTVENLGNRRRQGSETAAGVLEIGDHPDLVDFRRHLGQVELDPPGPAGFGLPAVDSRAVGLIEEYEISVGSNLAVGGDHERGQIRRGSDVDRHHYGRRAERGVLPLDQSSGRGHENSFISPGGGVSSIRRCGGGARSGARCRI